MIHTQCFKRKILNFLPIFHGKESWVYHMSTETVLLTATNIPGVHLKPRRLGKIIPMHKNMILCQKEPVIYASLYE